MIYKEKAVFKQATAVLAASLALASCSSSEKQSSTSAPEMYPTPPAEKDTTPSYDNITSNLINGYCKNKVLIWGKSDKQAAKDEVRIYGTPTDRCPKPDIEITVNCNLPKLGGQVIRQTAYLAFEQGELGECEASEEIYEKYRDPNKDFEPEDRNCQRYSDHIPINTDDATKPSPIITCRDESNYVPDPEY